VTVTGTEQADVVVIGAGFAGLTAARTIAETERSALVLEARDRVGGRTESVTVAGTVVDLGGAWAGPTQDHLYRLAEEMGVEHFPQWHRGAPVILHGGRATPVTAETTGWDQEDLDAEAALVSAIDDLAATVPLEAPWNTPDAGRLDTITAAQWLSDHAATTGGRDIVAGTVRNVFATEPENLSLLHLAFYVAAGGGWQSVVGLEDGAQKHRFVGGTQEIAVRLARALGDTVRLGWPVRRIEHSDRAVTAIGDRGTVTAQRAIVAIPATLTGRIDYQPPLPGVRDQLTQRVPAGSTIKFHAVYDRPFWRDAGLNGIIQSTDAFCRITLDGTPPDGAPGVIVGFLEGAIALAAARLDSADRRRRVLDTLAQAFGERAAAPLDYLERDWTAEPWTRGCYGSHLPPGAWTQFGPALRAPIGRLHWAGTETATRWMGYIDGAIESGVRAGTEAVEALSRP
jgi:monoamine oxidase